MGSPVGGALVGLSCVLAHRPQAADWGLGSESGHGAVVRGHMAFGHLWGEGDGGACLTLTHALPHCLGAWLGLSRAGALLFLSVPLQGLAQMIVE